MNKLSIMLAGVLALGAAMPAIAGPDFQVIEQARKAKQAARIAEAANESAAKETCAPQRLVLSLDHGPRAQTTPYVNALRASRFEAQVHTCAPAGERIG